MLTSATLTLFALPACSRQAEDHAPPAPAWVEVTDGDLTESQAKARDAALTAVGDLQQTLLSNVMQSIQENGPAGTIDVCNTLAPQLAQDVGAKHGVLVGRTSFRLRNPQNGGPEWMNPIIEQHRDQTVTFAGPNDAIRMAVPIHLATPCLMCHGQPDTLPTGVSEALASQYPSDQATGFAEGDLRGWFWVQTAE